MSIRRLALGPVLFVLASSSIAIAGCGSDSPPVARAYVSSKVSVGSAGAAACQVTEPTWIVIGTQNSGVNDGDNNEQGVGVHVSCSVTANSDGSFQVNALAALGNIGSVTMTGKFTTGHGDKQTGIRGVFQRGDGLGHFEESDCTATFESTDANFNTKDQPNAGVAAGRVWATMVCPQAIDSSHTSPLNCNAIAELKFENCSQ